MLTVLSLLIIAGSFMLILLYSKLLIITLVNTIRFHEWRCLPNGVFYVLMILCWAFVMYAHLHAVFGL